MTITLDELTKRQKAIDALLQEAREVSLRQPIDVEKLTGIAARASVLGQEFEKLGAEYVRQEETNRGPSRVGTIEVVLTEEQRKRIFDDTSVKMETIIITDDGGDRARGMPRTEPPEIESLALAEARRRKAMQASEKDFQAELGRTLQEIESQGGAAAAQLEELKKDPKFVGNKLKKT